MTTDRDRYRAFAVAAPGLEPLVERELRELGITARAEPGGVAWQGSLEQVYEANLVLRTATRVVVRIAEFRARTFFELERHGSRVDWARWIQPGRPVELHVTCRKSRLYHEGAVAERLQTAIERSAGATAAPSTDEYGEGEHAQLFVVRFLRDRCTISVDSSGALLHRRGYRQEVAKAPLRETLAAAILLGSGWDGSTPLLDPMCGSGTIPIEGALIARGIAPGLACGEPRDFAFRHWPQYEEALFDEVVARARQRVREDANPTIIASDRDAGAIEATRRNAERASVAGDLRLSVSALSAAQVASAPGTLATNPPYGLRVGDRGPLRNLYATLGRALRDRMPGWRFGILIADPELEAQIELDSEVAFETRNGGVSVRLLTGAVPD
jgi:putative N6-adenine-specific DNA methylase